MDSVLLRFELRHFAVFESKRQREIGVRRDADNVGTEFRHETLLIDPFD